MKKPSIAEGSTLSFTDTAASKWKAGLVRLRSPIGTNIAYPRYRQQLNLHVDQHEACSGHQIG